MVGVTQARLDAAVCARERCVYLRDELPASQRRTTVRPSRWFSTIRARPSRSSASRNACAGEGSSVMGSRSSSLPRPLSSGGSPWTSSSRSSAPDAVQSSARASDMPMRLASSTGLTKPAACAPIGGFLIRRGESSMVMY